MSAFFRWEPCMHTLRCVLVFCAALSLPAHALNGTISQSGASVNAYGVFELTVNHGTTYSNPWEALDIVAWFVGPSGDTMSVGGFYYQSGQWKARFAPTVPGQWSWSLTADHNGDVLQGNGTFSCTQGADRGFLRVCPQNPRRFAYADGSPFYPVGMEDCLATDGPKGFDGQTRTRPVYLDTFSSAGFNLFRISVGNCAYVVEANNGIQASGNRYHESNSKALDGLCQDLKRYGFRVVLCMFNNNNTTAYADSTANAGLMAAVKRYVKYYVDRWGAYVDIFETVNESYASFGQYSFRGWNLLDSILVPYIRQIDPYGHLVGQEFYPQQSTTDKQRFSVCMPHNYLDGTNTNQDSMVLLRNDSYWRCGIQYHEAIIPAPMPIVYGEWGNYTTCCWHPNSALWHRIRLYVLFFNEAAAISWHQNGTTYCGPPSNIALRTEERAYTRHFQQFCTGVSADVVRYRPATTPGAVHAYGLKNGTSALVYLYNTGSQASPQSGVQLELGTPFATGSGYWYSPATGNTISTVTYSAGSDALTVPPFTVDIALKVTGSGVAVGPAVPPAAVSPLQVRRITVTGNGVRISGKVAGALHTVDLRGRAIRATPGSAPAL